MLFNSLHFLVFFPVAVTLYFLLPLKYRNLLLLASSCYFYMVFKPVYVLILFFLIAVDYAAGILIAAAEQKHKKPLLVASLAANILVLAIFKYYNFINFNLTAALDFFWGKPNPIPDFSWVLPIGLSFHTFQSMSYTIEVYRGNFKAEKNLLVYAVYVMFFPQLVAGPIERPQNLIHQFHEPKTLDWDRVGCGLRLMIAGFFKKLFVADRLAIYVGSFYDNPISQGMGHGLPTLLATYFFAIQIYCDFSGYTDIARGAARVMGYTMMENFNYPYIAQSVSEFWRRWHISLSTWFKDYLYIPLGGNRSHPYRNTVIVFLVSGLWHGASWNFVIWGALHAFYITVGTLCTSFKDKLLPWVWLKILFTFHLVCFAWIFFRAKTFADAQMIIGQMLHLPWNARAAFFLLATDHYIRTCLLVVFALFAAEKFFRSDLARPRPNLVRNCVVYGILVVLILLGAPLNESAFIYFQF